MLLDISECKQARQSVLRAASEQAGSLVWLHAVDDVADLSGAERFGNSWTTAGRIEAEACIHCDAEARCR